MILGGIPIPDEIRLAIEEDRLVIFAGAGISMPPPSNLPSFFALAQKIVGAAVERGREDRSLGRAARNGTDVDSAVREIVYNENTKPTQLHHEAVRLFGDAQKVRVITTNFDNHFSAATKSAFGKNLPPEYYAPALPLGDDFRGLVYLHGAAKVKRHPLVLTDKDFGEAYITRGWARDFLVPLFSRYTVLFIGYSHNDVTMTYLARGLNPSRVNPRWVMTASPLGGKDRDHWQLLDIKLIEYPVDQGNTDNSHQSLTDFFVEWTKHRRESIFTKAKKLKSIARGLPPESLNTSEYLRYCLSHPQLARDFVNAIRHPAWVGWMHTNHYFDPLFEDTAEPPSPELVQTDVLADWLCSWVRVRFPQLLLNLVQSHQQQLTSRFSKRLSHSLWSDGKDGRDPLFSTWLAILLTQRCAALSSVDHAFLLMKCELPADLGVALDLFELITRPELLLERGWVHPSTNEDTLTVPPLVEPESSLMERRVEFAISWPDRADHWLDEAWTKVLSPHMAGIAVLLFPIVLRQLTRAQLLLRSVEKRPAFPDRLNWRRSSISPHEQDEDRFDQCFSSLIDILRDTFTYWIETDPQRAKSQADLFWSMEFPLFKRFAVFARAADPQYSADDALEWILAHDLVYRIEMKKEVFDVLAKSYPIASPSTRRRLLTRIHAGHRTRTGKRLDKEILEYEKFNVLVWLKRVAPDCKDVQGGLLKITKAYPHFQARDNPELEHWHGKVQVSDPTEGIDFDGILREPPVTFAGRIGNTSSGHTAIEDWQFFKVFTVLFSRDRDWGRRFVLSLADLPHIDAEMWNAVFAAWQEVIRTADDWNWMFEIVEIVENLPHGANLYAGVANLISRGVWKDTANLDDRSIDRAASLERIPLNPGAKLGGLVN